MALTNHTELAKRLPKWLYKFLAQRYIDLEFPRHLYIETTTRCNMACSSCPRPKIDKDMSDKTFINILAEVNKYAPRSISLHIFGEPLLDKGLLGKIHFLKMEKNNVILTTNGTIINERVFDAVDKIITTNPNFPPKWKKKTFIREFGKNTEYHNFGGHVKMGKVRVQRYPCHHLWLSPAIAWNGDMLMCCADPNHMTKIGNIKDHSIQSMWTSDKMQHRRRMHLAKTYIGICKDCNVWKTYPSIF